MSKRLLVIDDQSGMIKLVSHIAAGQGYEVKAVTDAMLATDAFLEFKPDIIVLDLVMPKKDGIEVLEEILETGAQTRIIVMSGYGEHYLRSAAGIARFHGNDQVSVIHKPFRRDALVELLEQAPVGA